MNKGLHGYPPRQIDQEPFHGYPKKRAAGESFYSFPSGRNNYDFRLSIASGNTTVLIQIGCNEANRKLRISWGDGSVESISPLGYPSLGTLYEHIFRQPGDYDILLLDDTESITSIRFSNAAITKIFPDGAKFRGIKHFSLVSSTNLNSMMPDISTWVNLEYINVANTKVYGDFPTFSHCPNIRQIIVSYTQLGGTLPAFDFNTQLTDLNCSICKISGEFPDMSMCSALQGLVIDGNKITGSPNSIEGCTNLKYINVENNLLSGPLFTPALLTKLTTCYLGGNDFSGAIPSYAGCSSLSVLYINQMRGVLTGQVPYMPASITYLSFEYCVNSTLSFPADLLISLPLLRIFATSRMTIGAPYTMLDVSANTTLQYLIINDQYGLANKTFDNGTCLLASNALVSVHINRCNGVSVGFADNFLMPDSANSIFLASNMALDIVLPIGNRIRVRIINLFNCTMSQYSVDGTIDNLMLYRQNFNNTVAKSLIISGNNASPSGTYQVPSGFTHDLTDAGITTLSESWSVKEKIWVLVNCQESTINTTKRYKWTITTS